MAQHLNQLSGTSSHLSRVPLAAIRQCSLSAACHFSSGQHPSILHSPISIPFGRLVINIPIRIRRSGDCYSCHFSALLTLLLLTLNVLFARSPDCDAFRKRCVSNNICWKAALPQTIQERCRSDCSGSLGGTGYHGDSGVIAVMQRLFVLGGDGIPVL